MTITNHHDVVPFNQVEYPTRNEVCCYVLSFYRQVSENFQLDIRIREVMVRWLDAEHPKHWDDICLNDAIIAQLQGSGRIPGPDLELPGWTEGMLGRLRLLEVRMMSGERVFQGAALLFIEN